jgi:diguanylate cyclase (GGDEF)-like protein
VAALFLDLDDFKTINDTLGHAAGDEVLVAVGERLRSALRGSDLAARLGGDEFGVLLRDLPDEQRAIEAAERLLTMLNEPLAIGDASVGVRASVGIAIDSSRMRGVDDLLGDADIAMYQAKAQGKGCYHVFGEADPVVSETPDQAWVDRGPTVRRRGSGGSLAPTSAEPWIGEPWIGEPRLEPGAG